VLINHPDLEDQHIHNNHHEATTLSICRFGLACRCARCCVGGEYTSYGHEYKSICIIVSCILTNLIHMINVYLLYQFRNHTQPLPSPSRTFVMSSPITMKTPAMTPAVLLKITPPIYLRMITMKTRRTLSMPRRERVSLCHAELNTSFCLFLHTHMPSFYS